MKDATLYIVTVVAALMALFLFGGCANMPGAKLPDGTSASIHSARNPHPPGTVAWLNDAGNWEIQPPPPLKYTGRTINGDSLQLWAKINHGIDAPGILGDSEYAQLESDSAIATVLWLKAFLRDTGFEYIDDTRDCNHFASAARMLPSLLADNAPAAPAVFEIWAHMDTTFANVSDGYHALNVAWTDKGIPVFEPQGIDLVYQDLRAWPNTQGITDYFSN